MKKLKVCPFCGGKAYFKTITRDYLDRIQTIEFRIECKDCRASIPKIFKLELCLGENGEIEFFTDERTKAVETWNSRIARR